VFRTDVSKVDQDVAYVAIVCTRMLQASILNVSSVFQMHVASVFIWMLHMFHTYVVSVLSENVFIWMLRMFHTYVASVLSGYCLCLQWFSSVLGVFFCKCFRCMFQVFHLSSFLCCKCCNLDVSKVDRVLQMLLWLCMYVSSASSVSDICC
jgi:hypothetical protein